MSISENTIANIRFGYGFSPGGPTISGASDVLDQVTSTGGARQVLGLHGRRDLLESYRMQAKRMREGSGDASKVEAARDKLSDLILSDFREDLILQMTSPRGFEERLVSFWADHFTVAAQGRRMALLRGLYLHEAIRPHLAGRFEDMLITVTLHPAMLIYLDQNTSIGPGSTAGRERGKGLNENLAREVLELHTLGVSGGYTQSDVTQFAELLTGLRVNLDGTVFRDSFAEPGAETVLGVTYGGAGPAALDDIRDALRDIARRPETANHLARKLVVHFVEDEPQDALVTHVAQAYLTSAGDLRAVYAALLEHPDAWAPDFRKAKQPYDYVVSSLRAFGVTGDDLRKLPKKEFRSGILRSLTAMGQTPGRPPGPDGWPEASDAWITPATLSARIAWATELGRRYGQNLDPRAFLKTALADATGPNTRFVVEGSESKWEGVALVLASPEFNRR